MQGGTVLATASECRAASERFHKRGESATGWKVELSRRSILDHFKATFDLFISLFIQTLLHPPQLPSVSVKQLLLI